MTQQQDRHFAYFITPHGYGHASRAAAVMNAIREQVPNVVFEIFTRVPVWFFNMSVQTGFHYHQLLTDIGLVQDTAMSQNLPETVCKLNDLLPYRPAVIADLARQVLETGCEVVLCDIAPMGIAVAQAAGLPSVLIENFTWEFMYAGYLDQEPGLAPYVAFFKDMDARADRHIRTDPACEYNPPADLLTHPVSRKPRESREATRERLGIARDEKMVLVTMGGILTAYPFLDRLVHSPDVRFLVPGGSEQYEQRGSLVLIPHHSDLYHPDLVEASDAVVGKLGYSTLAEAYSAGLPYAYIPRENFPESPPMARFVKKSMAGLELPEPRFFSGAWLDLLPELLSLPHRKPATPNGADEIARYLLNSFQ